MSMSTPSAMIFLAFSARFVCKVIKSATIALGTDLIAFVASSTRNHHSSPVDHAISVALVTVGSEINRRNKVIVWIVPLGCLDESSHSPFVLTVVKRIVILMIAPSSLSALLIGTVPLTLATVESLIRTIPLTLTSVKSLIGAIPLPALLVRSTPSLTSLTSVESLIRTIPLTLTSIKALLILIVPSALSLTLALSPHVQIQ